MGPTVRGAGDDDDALSSLEIMVSQKPTLIAALSPVLVDDTATPIAGRYICGMVTITWPYSAVHKAFAFLLAESDVRLRRDRGEVRVEFRGGAAQAVAECRLGGGDQILIGLDGVEWVAADAADRRSSLPGRGLEWTLRFSRKVVMKIKASQAREEHFLNFTEPDVPKESNDPPKPTTPTIITPLGEVLPAILPIPTHLQSPEQIRATRSLQAGEYESPAFLKRARTSYGSLFEDGYDIFEDDGGVKGKGRKKSRFSDINKWRYLSESPSPSPSPSPLPSRNEPEEEINGLESVEDTDTEAVEAVATSGGTTTNGGKTNSEPAKLPTDKPENVSQEPDVLLEDAYLVPATEPQSQDKSENPPQSETPLKLPSIPSPTREEAPIPPESTPAIASQITGELVPPNSSIANDNLQVSDVTPPTPASQQSQHKSLDHTDSYALQHHILTPTRTAEVSETRDDNILQYAEGEQLGQDISSPHGISQQPDDTIPFHSFSMPDHDSFVEPASPGPNALEETPTSTHPSFALDIPSGDSPYLPSSRLYHGNSPAQLPSDNTWPTAKSPSKYPPPPSFDFIGAQPADGDDLISALERNLDEREAENEEARRQLERQPRKDSVETEGIILVNNSQIPRRDDPEDDGYDERDSDYSPEVGGDYDIRNYADNQDDDESLNDDTTANRLENDPLWNEGQQDEGEIEEEEVEEEEDGSEDDIMSEMEPDQPADLEVPGIDPMMKSYTVLPIDESLEEDEEKHQEAPSGVEIDKSGEMKLYDHKDSGDELRTIQDRQGRKKRPEGIGQGTFREGRDSVLRETWNPAWKQCRGSVLSGSEHHEEISSGFEKEANAQQDDYGEKGEEDYDQEEDYDGPYEDQFDNGYNQSREESYDEDGYEDTEDEDNEDYGDDEYDIDTHQQPRSQDKVTPRQTTPVFISLLSSDDEDEDEDKENIDTSQPPPKSPPSTTRTTRPMTSRGTAWDQSPEAKTKDDISEGSSNSSRKASITSSLKPSSVAVLASASPEEKSTRMESAQWLQSFSNTAMGTPPPTKAAGKEEEPNSQKPDKSDLIRGSNAHVESSSRLNLVTENESNDCSPVVLVHGLKQTPSTQEPADEDKHMLDFQSQATDEEVRSMAQGSEEDEVAVTVREEEEEEEEKEEEEDEEVLDEADGDTDGPSETANTVPIATDAQDRQPSSADDPSHSSILFLSQIPSETMDMSQDSLERDPIALLTQVSEDTDEALADQIQKDTEFANLHPLTSESAEQSGDGSQTIANTQTEMGAVEKVELSSTLTGESMVTAVESAMPTVISETEQVQSQIVVEPPSELPPTRSPDSSSSKTSMPEALEGGKPRQAKAKREELDLTITKTSLRNYGHRREQSFEQSDSFLKDASLNRPTKRESPSRKSHGPDAADSDHSLLLSTCDNEGPTITKASLRNHGFRKDQQQSKTAEPLVKDPSLYLARGTPFQPPSAVLNDPESQDPSLRLSRVLPGSRRSQSRPRSAQRSEKFPAPAPAPVPATVSEQEEEEEDRLARLKAALETELAEKLPDHMALKSLRNLPGRTVHAMGIVTSSPPEAKRPKNGPRDYLLAVHLTDPATAPVSAVVVQVLRPHLESLPHVSAGDVLLLRNFKIMSLPAMSRGSGLGTYGLRSEEGSSWAVWESGRTDGLPQIKGPPVEVEAAETNYVAGLRKWWGLLDEGDRKKLEGMGKIIAGKDENMNKK